MKLVVAALLLASALVAAKVVVEHVAPEGQASASTTSEAGLGGVRGRNVVGPDLQGAAEAGEPIVASIRFTGPGLRAAFLADVIVSRTGAPLDRDALAADRGRVLDELVARGHLDATVGEPVVRTSTRGDHVAWVELPVDAGPRYTIRRVEVTGRVAAANPELAHVVTLRPGDHASGARIEAGAALLRDWATQRKVRGTVTHTVELDRFAKQVDVRFSID